MINRNPIMYFEKIKQFFCNLLLIVELVGKEGMVNRLFPFFKQNQPVQIDKILRRIVFNIVVNFFVALWKFNRLINNVFLIFMNGSTPYDFADQIIWHCFPKITFLF